MYSQNVFSTEVWKDIPGYEMYYQVSTYGKIRSLDRIFPPGKKGSRKYVGKILVPTIRSKSYPYYCVSLSIKGKSNLVTIHSLVMLTFIGSRQDNIVINHVDGNKLNNNLSNLEYCTQSHNIKEDFRNNRRNLKGERNTQNKLTIEEVLKILELRRTKNFSYRKLAELNNVCHGTIYNIINGCNWSHLTGLKK